MNGFLLDTNVISELIKPRPEPRLSGWIETIDESLLYLSVLTLGEIRKGIDSLPQRSRRMELESWLNHDLAVRFSRRILDVDRDIAGRWGHLAAKAAAAKHPLPVIDGLLVATALQHSLSFVTRNTKDVEHTGVPLFNPWIS